MNVDMYDLKYKPIPTKLPNYDLIMRRHQTKSKLRTFNKIRGQCHSEL